MTEALPPEYAQPVRLFYRDGLSVAELAKALGMPEGTVKYRLFMARKILARMA